MLIPAFKPSVELKKLVQELRDLNPLLPILVIDDGSGSEYHDTFKDVAKFENCQVVRHATNLGKGQALKTGINHIITKHSNVEGIVTADADGQHAPSDILKIIDSFKRYPRCLHLGTRTWNQAVPMRSRFGNIATRYALWFFTGMRLKDTQTGLRAIPKSLALKCLKIKSMEYEFELDMLLAAKSNNLDILEKSIKTIYLNDNASSHFNPIRDSMKIYFVFFRYLSVSVITASIDFLIFSLSFFYINSIAQSMFIARLSAGLFQFFVSKNLVFRHKGQLILSLTRFFSLVAFSGLFSYALIHFLTFQLGFPIIAAKLTAESFFFLASFAIQREFIFERKSLA